MAAPRTAIAALCKKLLPETNDRAAYIHWHQVGFDSIAKDHGQGFGTTCGFLPHWLLWRFGCRDNTLVNRSAPPEGLSYLVGENLSIFMPNAAKKLARRSWVALDTEQKTRDAAAGKGPQQGDFVIIRGGFWMEKSTGKRTRDSAHVFVLLEVLEADGKKVKWLVAQSGVSNDAMQQGAQITTLTGELRESEVMEGNQPHKGPNLVFIANILGEEPNFPRRVIGYTDLDQISFGAGPSPRFLQLFEDRWRSAATNEAGKVNAWLGWYELAPAGGWVPLHRSYVLLHRGHEAFLLERGLGPYACKARGLWTLTGTTIDVVWEDETPNQSWTMATTYVPKLATRGTPRTANTGALTRVLQIPPARVPPDIPAAWRVE